MTMLQCYCYSLSIQLSLSLVNVLLSFQKQIITSLCLLCFTYYILLSSLFLYFQNAHSHFTRLHSFHYILIRYTILTSTYIVFPHCHECLLFMYDYKTVTSWMIRFKVTSLKIIRPKTILIGWILLIITLRIQEKRCFYHLYIRKTNIKDVTLSDSIQTAQTSLGTQKK